MSYTIQSLTDSYVNREMGPLPQGQDATAARKRCEYNFKVTCLNVATVASIVTLALAILTGSTLMMALFAGSWMIRKSLMRAVLASDTNDAALIWSRMMGLDATGAIKAHLEIPRETEWELVRGQVLDFIVWMENAPVVPSNVAAAVPVNAALMPQQQQQ